MKKIIFILVSFLIMGLISRVNIFAATTPTPATPTTTPAKTTPEATEIDRIQKIKQLVASKVAELKLVEKRGILGNVKETTTTQITLEDDKSDTRIVDVDELTKFQQDSSGKSFGISDIQVGQSLSIIGLYNKETQRLLARFIIKANNIPKTISGIITDKDSKNFNLTIVTDDKKQKVIDISTSTKIYSYDKNNALAKAGFTKIEIGIRVYAVGFDDLKIKDQINSSRVIFFKDLPPSDSMKKAKDQLDAAQQTQSSTGSAKKLQQITK